VNARLPQSQDVEAINRGRLFNFTRLLPSALITKCVSDARIVDD